MSIKNKFLPCFVLLGLLGMGSCTKQLDTNLHNTNGLSINTLTGKDLFAQALVSTVTDKSGTNIITATDNYDYAQNWMGYWARNNGWSQSGVQVQIETFELTTSDGDGNWASLYHNNYDYDFIVGHSSPNSILPGASIVIRSMLFQDLVDQFGNIPYSQADNPNITTPVYDQAQTIYRDLVVKVDSAIMLIQASQPTVDDTADVMFHGSKALWLQFANTIKLRILLRQVPNVYAANDPYITTELSNVNSLGGFLPAGTDAMVQPGFADVTTQTQSPFWATYGFGPGGGSQYQEGQTFCANNVMLNFLDSTSDPRIGYFYDTTASGGYGGNPLGQTGSTPTSPIGPGILQSPSMPALLLSASQSLFMQAEAAQRGMISGSYVNLYRQAVEESFRYLGVPNYMTAADLFISSSANQNVNIGISSNALQTILYQKWVAECELDPLEAYSDYRRTGFPVFTIPISVSANPPTAPLPKRLLYPETEYTLNIANVQAQHQTQADQNTKIFWGE